jgi:hypothetical protein
VLEQFVAVPFSGLDATKPLRGRLAQRQQDMGMVIVWVVTLFGDRRMNGDIGHHAAADESLLDEI